MTQADKSPTAGVPQEAEGASAAGSSQGGLLGILKRGAVMSAVGVGAVQIIGLVQTLVLAHLLSPSEVGVFAAGTFLTAFVVVFSHSSLSHALIQRREDVEDAAETVFWATLVSGVLIAAVLVATAPVLSRVFGNSQVGAVAAVCAGTVVFTSLLAVPDAMMQRSFQFKRRIVVDPVNAVAFAGTSIVLAASGFGVWSMVAGYYAAVVVSVVASWWLAGWRPLRGRFRFGLWRELAGFSLPLLIESIVERAVEAAEVVLVGHRLQTAALGNYRNGRRLAFVPVMAILQICSYVLFPAFAAIAGEPERFKRGFMTALRWMWLAVVPVSALLGAVGEPAVVLLLGREWRGAGQLVSVMCGVGIGFALMSVSAEALKGAGRPQLINWMTVVGAVSVLGLVAALLPLGLPGVGLALSVAMLLTGLTGLFLSRSVVGVTRGELARCLIPPVIAGVLAAVAIGLLELTVLHAGDRGVAPGLGLVVLEALGFAGLYVVVLSVISPSTLAPVWSALRRK
ncbi:lipopolysaccharide biosynthesis protein [Nocardia huaxiensis]|uniref:Lipopolysaccharide biosynthesis protein n=1 Tax=Nocardia huaxiensis TaxID=2755382 RepID=A0A7D6Z657_9NOCA|nr:lipopolysaccharide biosynthesis protein [Nocardia huaxiensis]QLY27728.1 lipopolysaccharide biosynthesis protein [Nocardia huaxiensis]